MLQLIGFFFPVLWFTACELPNKPKTNFVYRMLVISISYAYILMFVSIILTPWWTRFNFNYVYLLEAYQDGLYTSLRTRVKHGLYLQALLHQLLKKPYLWNYSIVIKSPEDYHIDTNWEWPKRRMIFIDNPVSVLNLPMWVCHLWYSF